MAETSGVQTPVASPASKSPAEQIAEALSGLKTGVGDLTKRLDAVAVEQKAQREEFEKLKKPRYPAGLGPPTGAAPGVRIGEDPLTSRPYSFMRLAMAIRNPDLYREQAKVELDLSKRLGEAFAPMGWSPFGMGVLAPFSTAHMAARLTKLGDERTVQDAPGFPSELIKECGDLMAGSLRAFDPDELRSMLRKGISGTVGIAKDLSAYTDTSGGTLVPLPAQGELIDLLRPLEIFSRVGAQEVTLPPQGTIRFPRDTSDPTVAAFAEGATITESTPATGELSLIAKKYAALVDIPVELFKFATSVAVEAWLRTKFARRIAIQTDADMVNGAGGTGIKGVITYSAFRTVVASTVAANGNTLEANDPALLLADIEEQNARVDQGFFYAMRPNLWSRVTHRRADAVTAGDKAGAYLFNFFQSQVGMGADQAKKNLEGYPVITSTNIPATRAKGTGTTLTLLLAGVGSSWIIGRSGVVEIDMTNSDGSKFGQGLNTMRAMIWMDAGPEHEEEFGMIDTLLPTT